MPSLEILEGLIGAGCAVACLYYVRLGALAGPQHSVQPAVPWHSALGEYARRNPFAAVFGALAFGFLASSWSMYVAPRAIALPAPRVVEKWHVVTKNVAAPDPAQTAKIASLQTTIKADAAMIAFQNAEIASLKQLVAKSHRGQRSSAIAGGNTGGTGEGTAAALNKGFNPATAPAENAAPASVPPPATNQNTVTAPPAQTPDQASQNPASTPPH